MSRQPKLSPLSGSTSWPNGKTTTNKQETVKYLIFNKSYRDLFADEAGYNLDQVALFVFIYFSLKCFSVIYVDIGQSMY